MVRREQESAERKGFCSSDSSEFLTSISDLKFHKMTQDFMSKSFF